MTPTVPSAIPDEPGRLKAMGRGLLGRCPACGQGRLFGRFLKTAAACEACGTAFHHHRADDLPPYAVIFIVGHVVGYGIYHVETRYELEAWVNMTIWISVGLMMSLALLQPVKGAVVGLQYALGMHGFGEARAQNPQERRETTGVGHEGAEHHGSSHLHGT
jgi:uncharacterized protein (DUF983 family)